MEECIREVERRIETCHASTDGIYRTSGSSSGIARLLEGYFYADKRPSFQTVRDVHEVACTLKRFLSSLDVRSRWRGVNVCACVCVRV